MNNKKIFQILHGFCYWDATATVQTLDNASQLFAPSIRFEEAPSYVREGWAFDDTKEGDERFIQPTAPDGWYYDLEKGVFRPINEEDENPNLVEEVEDEFSESEDN